MPVLLNFTGSHGERIALPVEHVDLILHLAVKGLVGEVLLMEIHFDLDRLVSYALAPNVILLLADQLLFLKIPHEMVMGK